MSDAEKAAEEYAQSLTRVEPARFTRSDIELAFYSGAAWAAQHKYVSSNGKTSDSKSENEGSIPSACAITMQPFRAWVAWHPTQCDKAPRIFDATKSGAWFTLLAIQGYLKGFATDEDDEHAMRTAIEDGWRIVEVEVREVEK